MGWIGVDLDGTLAHYNSGDGIAQIGAPIPAMVSRVLDWCNSGQEVRIVTARADAINQRVMVEEWCKTHLGRVLPITDRKDFAMIELWDDRAVQVVKNTGQRVGCEYCDDRQ